MCTYSLTVNGKLVQTQEDKSLLRFLRDDLHLHSVKDGCSEGACGACTILADGKPVRACVLKTSRAEGKQILTVEGLADREKEIYVYAFGSRGAVQCGFCTPGMVMSAKALLDSNSDPSEDEIKAAIRPNLCRCTGYKKIIEAILCAARILRGEEEIQAPVSEGEGAVGRNVFRVDVREKLDCSEAEKLPGVLAVLTARDVPNNKVGHIQQDWDVMIPEGGTTRMMGDAICLLVAEKREILEEAKKLVRVEYEVLRPVRNIDEAMAEDAPPVHSGGNLCQQRHVKRGDAEAALARSKYKVSAHFETPFTEHAFLEPECAVAFPYREGIKVLSSDQGAYDTRREIAIMFGWDPEKIVVENQLVGGGFGGKEDVSVQHLAALAAWHVKRPVKVKLSRHESICFHPKRHAMKAYFTLGCDENGIFTGLDCEIRFDTGAYASLCGPVLERACTHAVGPYCYQNTDIRGYGYYTNNPPAGAFRGFGVSQSEFALEMVINALAEKASLSPWEIRWRNAIEPGRVLPNGQIADRSTALKETLLAVKEAYEQHPGHAGIACAMKNSGVGVGLPDKGRARIVIENGSCVIYSAASDIGQGCSTVFCQIAAQVTGLPLKLIRNGKSNTENAPDSGTTSGSRQTLLTGEAVRGAAAKLKEALEEAGRDWEALNGREFFYEYFEPTDPLGTDKPNPKSHIAYAYATNLAILDDSGKLTDLYAAYDAGQVVNPIALEGQIEGGALMSMGYALTEHFDLEDCVPKAKLGTLGLLRAPQIPRIHAITAKKGEYLDVACGAKGIGEITSIPAAPAIAGAYYALDGKFRTSLPLEDTFYSRKSPKSS